MQGWNGFRGLEKVEFQNPIWWSSMPSKVNSWNLKIEGSWFRWWFSLSRGKFPCQASEVLSDWWKLFPHLFTVFLTEFLLIHWSMHNFCPSFLDHRGPHGGSVSKVLCFSPRRRDGELRYLTWGVGGGIPKNHPDFILKQPNLEGLGDAPIVGNLCIFCFWNIILQIFTPYPKQLDSYYTWGPLFFIILNQDSILFAPQIPPPSMGRGLPTTGTPERSEFRGPCGARWMKGSEGWTPGCTPRGICWMWPSLFWASGVDGFFRDWRVGVLGLGDSFFLGVFLVLSLFF